MVLPVDLDLDLDLLRVELRVPAVEGVFFLADFVGGRELVSNSGGDLRL